MANIIFLDGLWSDVASIFPSSDFPGSPGSNLLLAQPSDVWRSNTGVLDVSFDLQGPSTGIDGVYVGNFNVTATGVKQIRTATTQANLSTSPAHVSPTTLFWPQPDIGPYYPLYSSWYLFPTRRTETWVRVTITDPGNPEGFLTGGVIRIGQIRSPERPLSHGSTFLFNDPSEMDRSFGGTQHVRELQGWDEKELPFNFATEADAIMFYQDMRLYGKYHPRWIHLNHEDTVYGYYKQAYCTMSWDAIMRPEWNIFQVRLHLHEMV